MDFISEKIADYLVQNSEKEPEILSRLNSSTKDVKWTYSRKIFKFNI